MKQFLAWRLRFLLGMLSRYRPIRRKCNRILGILTGGLGDKLMDLPAVRSLRREFPDAEFTLLVVGPVPPFFHAEADRLIMVENAASLALYRHVLRGFDVVFVNSIGVFDVCFEAAAFLSGARDLRGPRFSSVSKQRTVYTSSYTFNEGHETVVNLKGAGGETRENRIAYPLNFADEPSANEIKISDVIFHPGSSASGLANRWPAESYASLAGHLHAAGYSVLAVGSSSESALLDSLRTLAGNALQIRFDLTMEQLARLLSKARLVIANDSGIGHLAAAMGAPLITIMGANRPEKVAPVGPQVTIVGPRCEYGGCYNNPQVAQCLLCINRITAEEVLPIALDKLKS